MASAFNYFTGPRSVGFTCFVTRREIIHFWINLFSSVWSSYPQYRWLCILTPYNIKDFSITRECSCNKNVSPVVFWQVYIVPFDTLIYISYQVNNACHIKIFVMCSHFDKSETYNHQRRSKYTCLYQYSILYRFLYTKFILHIIQNFINIFDSIKCNYIYSCFDTLSQLTLAMDLQ